MLRRRSLPHLLGLLAASVVVTACLGATSEATPPGPQPTAPAGASDAPGSASPSALASPGASAPGGSPVATPPSALGVTPSPDPVTFKVDGSLAHPARVAAGQDLVIDVGLTNVGVQAGAPWFGVSNLDGVATFVGCTPACSQHGAFYGIQYFEFPTARPGRPGTYRLTFRPMRPGTLTYSVIVSGRPQPVLSDANATWDLTTVVR